MIEDYRPTNESIQNIYSNGLLTKPTPLHSMFMSGMGGFMTGYKFVGDIYRKSVGLPKDTEMQETLDLIEREKNAEGQSLTQRAGNWIGDMVGYSLSPGVLALGGVGGLTARGLAAGARYIAPKAAIPFLERQVGTMTVGEIGQRLTESALVGELSMAPLAFEEGSARVATAGGALGLAIGSIPVMLGLRKGLRPKAIEAPKAMEEKALVLPEEPKPSSEMEQWHKDYDNKLDTPENLQARATAILKKEGLDVNPVTHEVQFNLLNENDVKNLQTAVTDSLTSNVSSANRNHLIDYIINNRVDQIRSNPASQMMLRAYDNYLSGKLAVRESLMEKADRDVFVEIRKGKLNREVFLSQPSIEKAVKKLGREESHISQLPFTLPENIQKRIKLFDKIADLKKKTPVRAVLRRIAELEKQIPKVMKPKEELEYLYDKILKGKEYKNKLKSRAYQRLEELADHWPQARAIMRRINLEEQFEQQQAIKDTLSKIRKEVERPVDRTANPDNVVRYMKERINEMKPREIPIDVKEKTPKQIIEESSKVPTDIDTTLAEQKKMVDDAPKLATELKNDYRMVNDKIHQFKSSGKILDEFIACVLGSK